MDTWVGVVVGVCMGSLLVQGFWLNRTFKRLDELKSRIRHLELSLDELWGVVDGITRPRLKVDNDEPA